MRMTRRALLSSGCAAVALAQIDENPLLKVDRTLSPLPERIRNQWLRAQGKPDAVLVSLEEHASLPPLRGLRDERFLKAYLHWAGRAETVGYSGDEDSGTVFADVGLHDWILFRRLYESWQADAPAQADPLGYVLIKPTPGWNRIKVARRKDDMTRFGALPRGFTRWEDMDDRAIPDIDAVLAVAKDAAGQVISIYGSGFDGGKVELFSEDGPAEVLYAAHNQINGRVPGLHRVRVVVGGSTTPWVEIKLK